MKMWIFAMIMSLSFVPVSYCQAQDKDESLDAAIKSFLQAVEKNPKYAEAYYNLGILYGEKGLTDEAIAAYKKNNRD
ncbi:MAG: hypothetical protein AYP45_11505 [Candidatus Brocadia carolinensis]|uniref:Uncharacterized protein n=1 Tax=Candidatus Brocadia carolinensis TaxID=1004156 RepID=A0A1V4ASA7_9BACT|nr:MAG: hypothetical protein AYP45_11505 [Candidatus Brocadia caroliniensis]